MANPEHLNRLRCGSVADWNHWSKVNPSEMVDLADANMDASQWRSINLSRVDLRRAILRKADLRGANLRFSRLDGATLVRSDLRSAKLVCAQMSGSSLRFARLARANLTRAQLHLADLTGAELKESDLRKAELSMAQLVGVRSFGANYTEATLNRANLCKADLSNATLKWADLTEADLRCSALQNAQMWGAKISGIKLWESQRAGWKINGVSCESAFWDKEAKVSTEYGPGEFEQLHSEQTTIELFYKGGVSKFELNTLPALLQHLASLHKDANVRLKAIEETGGGAKICISVGDANAETVEKIRSDAMQVYQAQIALRDNEIMRLETEKKYLESFVSERLIKAMLSATTQNVFNAPVYGAAFPTGNACVKMHQIVNDNSGILVLLERIINRGGELGLAAAESNLLQAEVESAKAELAKPDPSPSLLSRSLMFIQKLAGEAITNTGGRLGERAVLADWSTWLHQLSQYLGQLG